MADEDQERFEDYIELERYIEELQAGKNTQPPMDLTPEQARIYRMAALFQSASPENAEPRLAFAEQLKAQLLHAREEAQTAKQLPETTKEKNSELPMSPEPPLPSTKKTDAAKPIRFFSRRRLLAGGAIAAASLAIGAGTTHLIEQNVAPHDTASIPTPSPSPSTHLEISTTLSTTWHLVTTLAALGQEAVRFTTDTLIGYVLRDSNSPREEQIVALSATCTHMGCIVRWQDDDRRFHCPCHDAVFAEDGTHVHLNYRLGLPPLPRLNTKIENGNVYVEVPQ